MSKPAKTYRKVPLDQLTEDPQNARVHGDRNIEAIRKSLERFGQVEPLVVRKGTNVVVGGNGRLRVMRDMGWTEADVHEVELTDVEARALGIALNRTAELAEWDEGILVRALEDLKDIDFDIGDAGFSMPEFTEVSAHERTAMKDLDVGEMTYRVVVTVSNEQEQIALVEKLESEGFSCQLLIS